MSDQDRKGGCTATFLKLSMATLLTLGGLNAIQNGVGSTTTEPEDGRGVAAATTPQARATLPAPTSAPKPTATEVPKPSDEQMKAELDRLKTSLPYDLEPLVGRVVTITVGMGNGKKANMPLRFEEQLVEVTFADGTIRNEPGLPFYDPEEGGYWFMTADGKTALGWYSNKGSETGFFAPVPLKVNKLPQAAAGVSSPVNYPPATNNEFPWLPVGSVALTILGGAVVASRRKKDDEVETVAPRQSERRSPDEIAALAKMADQMIRDNAIPPADRKLLAEEARRAKRAEQEELKRLEEEERKRKRARGREATMRHLVEENQTDDRTRRARRDVLEYVETVQQTRGGLSGVPNEEAIKSGKMGTSVGDLLGAVAQLRGKRLVESLGEPEITTDWQGGVEAKYQGRGAQVGVSDFPGRDAAETAQNLARRVWDVATGEGFNHFLPDDGKRSWAGSQIASTARPNDHSPIDQMIREREIDLKKLVTAVDRAKSEDGVPRWIAPPTDED